MSVLNEAVVGSRSRLLKTSRDVAHVDHLQDVRTLELLSSRGLPSSPLAVAYLPAAAPGTAVASATADGQQQTLTKQQQPLWLVACRDGAVYGYPTGQQGTVCPRYGTTAIYHGVSIQRSVSCVLDGQSFGALSPARQLRQGSAARRAPTCWK